MDETYIIIEEDNERKILPEGEEIREAYRETEKRFQHLVEPAATGVDLAARLHFRPRKREREAPQAEE